MTPSEVPDDVLEALLYLEAKQVLRGFKSELFPNMTQQQALMIRKMDSEQLKEYVKKMIPEYEISEVDEP